MNMQDDRKENLESGRVVELLTPKFQRKCEFSFAKPRKRLVNKIWAISGVAAMFVVALTVAIKSTLPVSATEVINSAFTTLTGAESIKVEFVWRGIKTSAEEIYSPAPSGNVINGTLYLLRSNDKVKTRIDWHDAEKNSIVFDGSNYIHFQGNRIAGKHLSAFGDEIMNLFSQNTLPDGLKGQAELSTEGTMIMIKTKKDDITFCGEFQKDSKRLVKASAIVSLPDGQNMTMLETKSIETDIDIPDSLFCE